MYIGDLLYSLVNSLILSKITTVSFKEYPTTVNNAAMKDCPISMSNGIQEYAIDNTDKTISISWNTAATAPRENCHLRNRSKIYKTMNT